MYRSLLVAIVAATLSLPAMAQSTSDTLGVNDKGETVSIDTKTIRNVEYPKAVNGVFSVPPQKATYRETWVRSVKEGKITGQYLWLFDCQGSAVEMASADSTDLTARAKSTGVETLLRRIPPDSFYEMAQTQACKT
jgi:hypothetical protein